MWGDKAFSFSLPFSLITIKIPQIKFYGSQVGGKAITPHSYTGSPLKLLRHDILSALSFAAFLPFIVSPLTPHRSGPLCELYPSFANLWALFLHLILVLIQLLFIFSIPFWVFFPVWWMLLGITVFLLVNQGICFLLNGGKIVYPSNEKYTPPRKEHKHEQWIFLNGIAIGSHWLQCNIDRLALTFGRPVLGIHNKTYGILFDVIQCLIQRNFTYATEDIRSCYEIMKSTLYEPHLTKVVFILHSQGAIEGGMIIDWLLQEVHQDLLAKLEVYTFGNAANHFNNPHIHLSPQHAPPSNPIKPSTTKTTTYVYYHDPISAINGYHKSKSSHQSLGNGTAIRHIEHYAHTSDFVARFGVLYFISNFSLSPNAPRFIGRVFESLGSGHLLNQHYLDSMFPLKRSAKKGGGIGGSGFEGCDEQVGEGKGNNEFMDAVVEWEKDGHGNRDEREGLELSYLGAHGEFGGEEEEAMSRYMGPNSPTLNRKLENARVLANGNVGEIKEKAISLTVSDLSRLWLYRNGRSPEID